MPAFCFQIFYTPFSFFIFEKILEKMALDNQHFDNLSNTSDCFSNSLSGSFSHAIKNPADRYAVEIYEYEQINFNKCRPRCHPAVYLLVVGFGLFFLSRVYSTIHLRWFCRGIVYIFYYTAPAAMLIAESLTRRSYYGSPNDDVIDVERTG